MKEQKLNYNQWFLGVFTTLFISLFISYFVPKLSTPQPIVTSIVYISIVSAIILAIMYLIKRNYKLPKKFLIVIVTIFLISTSVASGIFYSANFITTPNVVNMSQENATALLKEVKLDYEVKYENVNDSTKGNIVISQNPKNGILVSNNSKITLIVGLFETIKINEPLKTNSVGDHITLNGITSKLQPNDKIYVLVQPQPRGGDGPYEWYIQPPAIILSNGSWVTKAYFGEKGDEGRTFKIVAIISSDSYSESKFGFKLPSYKAISDPLYITR